MPIGRSLPTWPEGVVCVVRTPFTTIPSIVCEPRDSVFDSRCSSVAECFVRAIMGSGGTGGTPLAVCTKEVTKPTDDPVPPSPAARLGHFDPVFTVEFDT